jgi:uncharacterized protein (TIGR00369 family)
MTDTIPAPADKRGSFNPQLFDGIISSLGHGGHLGMQFRAYGDNWVELELPYAETLIGDVETGVIASGPIISLMDSATSLSVWTAIGEFRPQVTLDLRVDYMRPATPGKSVIGRGECYKVTRSMAFVRGIAHDGDPDDPVAHVAGTFIRIENFLG